MTIIYIASPYSSYGDKQAAVDAQIDAFATLRDLGYEPIAPLLSHYIDQRHPASYERWMQWCLAMVRVSDVLLRVGGASAGADREVAEAKRLGKPVVYGIDSFINPGAVYEVAGDAPYRAPADDGTGYILVGMPKYGVSVGSVGSQPRQDYTWQDFRREHLAQFEAMVDALPATEKAPYTWAEYQAANKQALDEIAAFVGGTRE